MRTERQTEARKNQDNTVEQHQTGVDEALELLRSRFSSVRVKTWIEEDGMTLGFRLGGSSDDLEARRCLAKNLEHLVPATLSIIGIKIDPEEITQT